MGALFVFCPVVLGQAEMQDSDMIAIDNNIADDTIKQEYKHSPQIATLASAIIPGLGQAYNRKYWKIPIVWGTGIALYAYYDVSNSYYHRYKLAYEQYEKGLVTDPELEGVTKDRLEWGKEKYFRRKNYALLYMGLLYVANIVDAMVDAHLFNYDISQNLSLQWQPTITPPNPNNYSSAILGINVQLKF